LDVLEAEGLLFFNPSPHPALSRPNETSSENPILFYIHSDSSHTSVPA